MATQNTIEPQSHSGADSEQTIARRSDGNQGPQKLAKALGWFSIALGAAEVIAPRALSRLIGVPRRNKTIRMMGVREVVSGIGLLTSPRPSPWLWARFGGDMLDLAALKSASTHRRADVRRVSIAMGAVAGVAILDAACAKTHGFSRKADGESGTRFTQSVFVNRPPQECYQFWHNIEQHPAFMTHLKSVRVTGEGRSHWIAKGPSGREISWDAEITEDMPNESIAWRSLEGADIPNFGRVRFEAARQDKATIVRILMDYELPAGASILATLVGRDPGAQVRKSLLRFKQLLETGEISTTEGQSAGRPSGATLIDQVAGI